MALRNTARRWKVAWAVACGLLVMLTPWPGHGESRESENAAAVSDASSDSAFQQWLEALRNEALSKGIANTTLDAALDGIAPLARVIELDRRQPEFTQTFWSYLDHRVNDRRIEKGTRLLAKHGALLGRIQDRYGVPAHYLVAFWGLETNFGEYTGGFRVVNALATLAFDRRRSQFFRTQLLDALLILDAGHISADGMTGSWAGAMGQMQFMPSTFIGHAVDYTGDGRKDIWKSLPDAFASAANFLNDLGWRPREIWGREVLLPKNFDLSLATMGTQKTIAQWSALGLRRADGRALPQADMQGAVILPQGHKGPVFLVYDNFRVIMRWNRSINYALCVGHLADRIVGRPDIRHGRSAAHKPLSREEMKTMQDRLNRLGLDAGSVDGVSGPRTQAAIRSFQKKNRLPPDGYASPSLLQRLISQPAPAEK